MIMMRVRSLIAAAAVVLVLPAAACTGGPASPGAGSSDQPTSTGSYVAYSVCMRSHAIPNFPDPDPRHPEAVVGKESAQQLGVSTAVYDAAHQACAHLIPLPGGESLAQQQETQCAEAGDCSQAVLQQWMSGLRTLAQCLRTHGEPNWPDPVIRSVGGHPPSPHFPYDQAGIDHHSQHVLTEVQSCIRLTGFDGLPLP